MARAAKKRTTMGRAKVSKAKARKADNSCCPVIKLDCYPAFKKTALISSGVRVGWKKEEIGKRCTIKFGKRTYKRLDSSDAGKKVNELKKALASKRCISLVESKTHRKAPPAMNPDLLGPYSD